MKILILSDSHGMIDNLLTAAEIEKPDIIMHMGDYASDCENLYMHYPNADIKCVRGNCDRNVPENVNAIEKFTLQGKRFFITHGHLFGVKQSTDSLIEHGLAENADVILYGHTHCQHMQHVGQMLVVNPGSIGYDRDYAVMQINNGEITVQMKHLDR